MSEQDEPLADSHELHSHVEKWLKYAPEIETALIFTGSGRARSLLWGALLNEWLEAIFNLSNPSVAQAKLSWWGDALSRSPLQSPHPLIRGFAHETQEAVTPALWMAMTNAALDLVSLDSSPSSIDAVYASRRALASAIVEIESAIWPQAGAGDVDAVLRSLILWQWRHHRANHMPQPAWIPMQLLARHNVKSQVAYEGGDSPERRHLLADYASELLARPIALKGPRLRRICTGLDGLFLSRLAENAQAPFAARGFSVLWRSWRSARGVAA